VSCNDSQQLNAWHFSTRLASEPLTLQLLYLPPSLPARTRVVLFCATVLHSSDVLRQLDVHHAPPRACSFPFKPFSAAYVKKALAEGVDWRTKGCVTPVKSQGAHGVCGTFGQTQSAESQYALGGGGANPSKQPNKLMQFSEQQVLSCKCQKTITPACGGSTHSDAWIFYGMAPVPGLESAQSYPFNNSNWPDSEPPPCHFDKAEVLPHSVFSNSTSISHEQSSGESYGQLEAMVHFNGPMQIGINAGVFKWKYPHGQAPGDHWVNKSGCAAATAAGLKGIDHSLGVVGFGTDPDKGACVRACVSSKSTCCMNKNGFIEGDADPYD
jgi:hypothetical protein